MAHAVPMVSDAAMVEGGKYRWDRDVGDVQKSYNRIGMEKIGLTREQEIEAMMGIFGGGRMTAEAFVARQHGESAGSCVAVDKDGNEIPAAVAIRENKPAA